MTEELKDPAEYDDFAAAIRHNERVTTRRYDSVGPVALETVYETIIHWDEGGGKRSRRELARRIVDLYTAPPQPAEPIEPVAWSYELATTMLEHGYDGWEHRITRYKPNVPEGSIRNLTPLYAAPTQRKPLTEEEIDGLMQSIGLRCADDGNERMANHAEWERRQRRRIARAIERAHGIGGNA